MSDSQCIASSWRRSDIARGEHCRGREIPWTQLANLITWNWSGQGNAIQLATVAWPALNSMLISHVILPLLLLLLLLLMLLFGSRWYRLNDWRTIWFLPATYRTLTANLPAISMPACLWAHSMTDWLGLWQCMPVIGGRGLDMCNKPRYSPAQLCLGKKSLLSDLQVLLKRNLFGHLLDLNLSIWSRGVISPT